MMSRKGWKTGFKLPPRYTPPYYQRTGITIVPDAILTGIGSSEALGILGVSLNAQATGIGSGEALGKITASLSISGVGGIASAGAIGGGAASALINASGIASAEASGQAVASVSGGAIDISNVGGIPGAEAVGQLSCTLEPLPEISGGQPGKRKRGGEYGLVEYPRKGKRKLTVVLQQRRQVFDANLEAYQVPEAIGGVNPVMDILAEFEQAGQGFAARMHLVGDLVQKKSRFNAQVRLGVRIAVALHQGGQEFAASIFTRKAPPAQTPAWISDILRSEALRIETDDEEAILTILMASRR